MKGKKTSKSRKTNLRRVSDPEETQRQETVNGYLNANHLIGIGGIISTFGVQSNDTVVES
jgi:hypothetical protein